jgi:hypothetical protein
MKQRMKEIEKKIDDNWDWFKLFDRRVYLLHVQMAAQANKEWKDELIERYRFQDAIQRLYKEADHHQEKAFLYTKHLLSMSPDEVHPEFLGEVMQVLRDSWRALKKIIQDAREINLPAMKNFEEGERLADFILETKMVPEPPLSYVKGNWCLKLVDQLGSVRSRCFRLHFKSVGGILALQEKIAAAWIADRAPVPAEIIDPETILAAEVIPAEVVVEGFVDEPVAGAILAAEVLPAEVKVVSFVEALPLDDVEEPPPLISEPAGAPLAAFVAAQPHQVAVPPTVPPVTAGHFATSDEPVIVAEVVPESPPAPEPVEAPAFSLNLDAASSPAAAPIVSPPVEPAAAPAEAKANLPPVDVFQFDATECPTREESVFTLDAQPAKPMSKPNAPFGKAAAPQPVPAEEVFSLDADGIPLAEVVPAEEVISLGADAIVAEPVAPAPTRPAFGANPSGARKPGGSGSTAAPAARPAGGSGTSASMPALAESNGAAKPVVRKRPAVKITIVKPGEKSPFGN